MPQYVNIIMCLSLHYVNGASVKGAIAAEDCKTMRLLDLQLHLKLSILTKFWRESYPISPEGYFLIKTMNYFTDT